MNKFFFGIIRYDEKNAPKKAMKAMAAYILAPLQKTLSLNEAVKVNFHFSKKKKKLKKKKKKKKIKKKNWL